MMTMVMAMDKLLLLVLLDDSSSLLHEIILHRILLLHTIFALGASGPDRSTLVLNLVEHNQRRRGFAPLIFSPLVTSMVHSQRTSEHLRAPQIVHRQICASLVVILDESKAARLSAVFVTREIDGGWIAILRADGENIAFIEIERQATNVDPGCVAVIGVP